MLGDDSTAFFGQGVQPISWETSRDREKTGR